LSQFQLLAAVIQCFRNFGGRKRDFLSLLVYKDQVVVVSWLVSLYSEANVQLVKKVWQAASVCVIFSNFVDILDWADLCVSCCRRKQVRGSL